MRKKVSQNETPQDLLENYRSRLAKPNSPGRFENDPENRRPSR